MGNNYATSHKRETKAYHRYAVTYLDLNRNVSFTFKVIARSQSEATARVICYIEAHRIHPFDHPYYLEPAIAPGNFIPTYNVTEQ